MHAAKSQDDLEMIGKASIENVEGHQENESLRKWFNTVISGDDGRKGGWHNSSICIGYY